MLVHNNDWALYSMIREKWVHQPIVTFENWWQSLLMWLCSQRYAKLSQGTYENVCESWNFFHKYLLHVQKTRLPELPKSCNFVAIPKCYFYFQFRRITFDTDVLTCCAKHSGFRRKLDKKSPGLTSTCWFLSVYVSATVLFLRAIRPEPVKSKEELIRHYNAGTFRYELGIDTSIRTWNPTERLTLTPVNRQVNLLWFNLNQCDWNYDEIKCFLFPMIDS